jgi:thioredoxin reductase
MIYDCAIVGGGPAGLNAALVLGRAKRSVALFDNSQPRNGVAHASHGFITRDGIQPAEFRRIAYEEVLKYPSVRHWQAAVSDIQKAEHGFTLLATSPPSSERIQARKVILAAGLKEKLPDIKGIHDFYGKTLFNCPFCDGWELRDRPLAIVSDHPAIFHTVKLLRNWSRDLVVCTNGSDVLTSEQKQQLDTRGIRVVTARVAAFSGQDGELQKMHFADGSHIERGAALVAPTMIPNARFSETLGYHTEPNGAITTDAMGRTTTTGVFAAGDSAYVMPSQLIYAAASGSKAAMAVVAELIEVDWQSLG